MIFDFLNQFIFEKDEHDLREFSSNIVAQKINCAYQNVLKEEYDKKLLIIRNESKNNHLNIASNFLFCFINLFWSMLSSDKYNVCGILRKNP